MGAQDRYSKLKAKAQKNAASFKKIPGKSTPRAESRIIRIMTRLGIPHAIDADTGLIDLGEGYSLHWSQLYSAWAYWVEQWQTLQAPEVLSRAPSPEEAQAELYRLVQANSRFFEAVSPYFFRIGIGVVELPNKQFAVYQQDWVQESRLPDGSHISFVSRSRFMRLNSAISEARRYLRKCRHDFETFLAGEAATTEDPTEDETP